MLTGQGLFDKLDASGLCLGAPLGERAADEEGAGTHEAWNACGNTLREKPSARRSTAEQQEPQAYLAYPEER